MRRLADWIEYMEGEGDLMKMGQLSMLLKHSIADQVVLDNLRRLRRIIKMTDPAEQIADSIANAEFLGDFHKRVMMQFSDSKKAEPQPSEEPRPSAEPPDSPLSPDEDPNSSLGSCSS